MRTILVTMACLLAVAATAAANLPAELAPAAAGAPPAAALLALPGGSVSPAAGPAAGGRAAWLLARADLPGDGAGRQGEIGGTRGGGSGSGGGGFRRAVPVLASLVVPGAGHILIGHYVEGVPLVALDVWSWTRVKHEDDLGKDVRQEYLAYAEAHWSESQLADAFDPLADWEYAGIARRSYLFPDVQSYQDLPLWVSREDDEREWFENLGKWDQFVFGWDDFQDPATLPGFDASLGIANLRLPGISVHREVYRGLRQESNDHFERRDRYIYLNIATRVLSAFHVAWLEGLLGGEPRSSLAVAGHPVDLVAQPVGLTGSRLAVAVAY